MDRVFYKGDFTGVASLYTDDAVALPPGSATVRGKSAMGRVERIGGAGQRPESHDY